MALTPPFSVCNQFCAGGNDNTSGKDGYAILDLGEIINQSQLDNVYKNAVDGWMSFTSKHPVLLDESANYGFLLGNKTYYVFEYRVYSIVGTTSPYFRQQWLYVNEADNYNNKKAVLFRIGTNNDVTNSGMMFNSYTDIELLSTNAQMTSKGNLSIIPKENLSLLGNYVYLNPLCVQIMPKEECRINTKNASVALSEALNVTAKNINVTAENKVLFQTMPKAVFANGGYEAPLAFGRVHNTYDTASPTISLIPPNMNTVSTYGVISSLTIEPLGVNLFTDDLNMEIVFDTGDTAPTVTYSAYAGCIINWQGTDCTLDNGVSVFAPSPNMHYEVLFYRSGNLLVGKVNGFAVATSNVVGV